MKPNRTIRNLLLTLVSAFLVFVQTAVTVFAAPVGYPLPPARPAAAALLTLDALEISAQTDQVVTPRTAGAVTINSTVFDPALPAGTTALFVIVGVVGAVDNATGEWQIGTPPLFVYESAQTVITAAPRVGDSVTVVAKRTLAPGPLVAAFITLLDPGPLAAGPASLRTAFLFNGLATTIGAAVWTVTPPLPAAPVNFVILPNAGPFGVGPTVILPGLVNGSPVTVEYISEAGLAPLPGTTGGPVPAPLIPSEVRQAALTAGLLALSPNLAPDPDNLVDFLNPGLAARAAGVQLGKSFFFDTQVGSDGQACASCHFSAGADNRTTNQMNPGFRHVPPSTAFNPVLSGNPGGPNYTLTAGDYPLHVLQDPSSENFNTRTVLFDSDDSVSSQGVFGATFTAIVPGQARDAGIHAANPVFKVGNPPINVRGVEPRNTPTVINAVFNFSNFWDGRANNEFNGVSPFGPLDDSARILVLSDTGVLQSNLIRIPNSSLASQAVGPPLNDLEMSFAGRTFPLLARKMLDPALRPLGTQIVDPTDSVLGPLAAAGGGLTTTYDALIRQTFQSKYWASPTLTNGFTQMESNFSLFWGLAVQLYEATLISDQSPFDRFMAGDDTALTQSQLKGLLIFIKTPVNGGGIFQGLSQGNCVACHAGPEFTEASLGPVAAGPIEIHRTAINNAGLIGLISPTAYTDRGFANIGVRPTSEDMGRGVSELGTPLSFTKQALLGISFAPALPVIAELGIAPPPDNRIAVDGSFKVPGLRNVELTGPYFHNGGQATIGQVMSFYQRHGDFTDLNLQNVEPNLALIDVEPQDEATLVNFLMALTDDRVRQEQAPFDHPQIFVPNGHPGNNISVSADPLIPQQAADNLMEVRAVGAAGRPALGLPPLTPFLGIPQQAPPLAPANLAVAVSTPGNVSLTWVDNSPDELGFRIQRSSSPAFTQDLFEDVVGPGITNYIDAGGSAGVTFFYRVFAFSEAADSLPSNVISTTPLPASVVAPAPPANLDARLMRGPTSIDLVWADMSTNETAFRIERSDNAAPFVLVGTVGASINRFSDVTIIVGHIYNYRVIAANAAGQNASVVLAVEAMVPIKAPRNPGVQSVSANVNTLNWKDTASNEVGWRIERSVSNLFNFDPMIFILPNPSFAGGQPGPEPLTLQFSDTTVVPGTYFYRIFSFNDLGDSPPSLTVSVTTGGPTPPAPSSLNAAAVSSTQVNLTWIDNATNETLFMVQRAADAAFSTGLTESHPPASSLPPPSIVNFSDLSAVGGTTYFYRVMAGGLAGDSLPSNMVTVTTPPVGAPVPPPPPVVVFLPAPPLTDAGKAPVLTPVKLFGLVSTDELESDEEGTIEADTQVKSENDEIILIFPSGTRTLDSTGHPIKSLEATKPATLPPPPPGAIILRAYTLGPDGAKFEPGIALRMRFDKTSVPPGSNLYIAYWDVNFSQWVKIDSTIDEAAGIVSARVTHFTDYALIAEQAVSAPPVVTLPDQVIAPPMPTDLKVTVTASGAVSVQWMEPPTNETGFMIERALDSDFTLDVFEFHAAAKTSTITDITVEAGKTYYYRVVAVSGVGHSDYSQPVSVTTPPAPLTPEVTTPAPATPSTIPAQTTMSANPPPTGNSSAWVIFVLIGAALIVIIVSILILRRKSAGKK